MITRKIDQNTRDLLAKLYGVLPDVVSWFKATHLVRQAEFDHIIEREPTADQPSTAGNPRAEILNWPSQNQIRNPRAEIRALAIPEPIPLPYSLAIPKSGRLDGRDQLLA